MTPTEAKPFWIALGVDPLAERVIWLATAMSKEAADKAHRRAADTVVYRRSFNLTERDSPGQMHAWLRSCGVPNMEAINVLRQLGDKVQSILTEAKRGT